jgi:putative transposase
LEFSEGMIRFLAIRRQIGNEFACQFNNSNLVKNYAPITRSGTSRLRAGRVSQQQQIYHITSSTLQRQQHFSGFSEGRLVVRAFRREEELGHVNTLAFVVMPDHFHWLFVLVGSIELATIVGNAKSLSARWINRSLHRTGPLWQPGYYDRAIRREEDIAAIARYIIANPLRAGLVTRIGDYPLWDAAWI